MKLAAKVKSVCEGVHYNTKIRSLDEKAGIRRIRMGMRESARLIGNILNPQHPTPNPASKKDGEVLEKCREALVSMSEELGTVRTSRRIREASFMTTVADSDDLLKKNYEDELESLDKQIEYCKERINSPEAENWEKKEYQKVISDCEKRKSEVGKILKNIEGLKK